MKNGVLLFLLLLSTMFVGCRRDVVAELPIPDLTNIPVGFAPQSADGDFGFQFSRAIVSGKSDLTDRKIGVFAYYCPSTDQTTPGAWSDSYTPSFMYNVQIDPQTGRYVNSSDQSYWPLAPSRLAFFAYWPYGDSSIVLSNKDAVGAPVLTYTANYSPTAPTTAGDGQKSVTDMLVSSALLSCNNATNGVELPLGHALAKLQFNITADETAVNAVTLRSVKLVNVRDKGEFTWRYNSETDKFVPSCSNSYSDNNQSGIIELYKAPETGGVVLTSTAVSFDLLVVPQTLNKLVDVVESDPDQAEVQGNSIVKTRAVAGDYADNQYLIVEFSYNNGTTTNIYTKEVWFHNVHTAENSAWKSGTAYIYSANFVAPSANAEFEYLIADWDEGTPTTKIDEVSVTNPVRVMYDDIQSINPNTAVYFIAATNQTMLDDSGKYTFVNANGVTVSYTNLIFEFAKQVTASATIDLDTDYTGAGIGTELSKYAEGTILNIVFDKGTSQALTVVANNSKNTVGAVGNTTTRWTVEYKKYSGSGPIYDFAGSYETCNDNLPISNTFGVIRLTRTSVAYSNE